MIIVFSNRYYYILLLSFIFVVTEIIIMVTVVINHTYLAFFFKFLVGFCWFASFLPHLSPSTPPQKLFCLRDYNKNKATQICVLSLASPLVYFLFYILHYSSVFDCKFIWKHYVNFSFINFIFVMMKDT